MILWIFDFYLSGFFLLIYETLLNKIILYAVLKCSENFMRKTVILFIHFIKSHIPYIQCNYVDIFHFDQLSSLLYEFEFTNYN